MSDRAGQVLGGRYRLVERIGAGGMSEVYRAEHVELGRPLAVKLLLPAIAADQVAIERLRREAMSTSNLGHPNIVQVLDFDYAGDGAPYLVMQWLEGETLADCLGSLPVESGAELIAQACDALAAAHAAGVVHRDVKPANLFVTRDRAGVERLVVLDFGIAKLGDEQHLTRTGTFVGTPDYMSPEQAEGAEVDGRTDVYSVGVILYELACGALPFEGANVMEILHDKLTRAPVPPSQRTGARPVSPALESLILHCLARDADQRFESMDELAAAIRAAIATPGRTTGGGPVRRRRRPPLWGVALVLALTAGAIYGGVQALRAAGQSTVTPRSEAQVRFGGPLAMLATVSPLPVLPERPLRIRIEFPEGGPAEVAARYVIAGPPGLRPEYEARLPVSAGGVTFGLVPRTTGPHRLHVTAYDQDGAELGGGSFGICVGGLEQCPALATPDAPGSLLP